jgi:hypothetical protein
MNRFRNAFKRFVHQRIEFSDGTPVFQSRQIRYTSIGTGWTTLALINAALAGNDGGSSFGTFILSLGLGPVVTLYLAVTSGQRDRDLERRR